MINTGLQAFFAEPYVGPPAPSSGPGIENQPAYWFAVRYQMKSAAFILKNAPIFAIGHQLVRRNESFLRQKGKNFVGNNGIAAYISINELTSVLTGIA